MTGPGVRSPRVLERKDIALMMDLQLTASQEQLLREQVITHGDPGPVLDDFGMILEFLEDEGGVKAAGKYNLLPIKFIDELDQRLSRPLHLKMKRPQLRSHPYLQGLHLLLRASGLGRMAGVGARARLCVDPAMLSQWNELNDTERYFNLLEAWLRLGQPEMIGEQPTIWSSMALPCLQVLRPVLATGSKFELGNSTEVGFALIFRELYQLALMDLFGLVEVQRPPRPVAPWCPAGVKRVPFGDALAAVLMPAVSDRLLRGLSSDQDEEYDEPGPTGPHLGAWQAILQPYFPEWRENLKFDVGNLREGAFIFQVSWNKVWRMIAVPAAATLEDLLYWVLRSFNFDDEHLCRFTYRDRMGRYVQVHDPDTGEFPTTDQIQIGTLPLEPGKTMELLYDFGDNWKFTITLNRIEPPGSSVSSPGILESHGKAPPQYPGWDD